jgi:hypothetical protein
MSKPPVTKPEYKAPDCPKCGGPMIADCIWNMGNTNPIVPDFIDVWHCRDCGHDVEFRP